MTALLILFTGILTMLLLPWIVRRHAGPGLRGRFLAVWMRALSFTLTWAWFMVLEYDGTTRFRGAMIDLHGPSVFLAALLIATLFAGVETFRARQRSRRRGA